MVEIQLQERTRDLLEDASLGTGDIDATIRHLLEAEILRRMARYRRVDHSLSRQYGMTFDEFIRHRVTRQRGYSWEVEQDAMAWETARGGLHTAARLLRELRAIGND